QKVETEKVGLQTDLAEANEAIEALNRQKEDLQSEVETLDRKYKNAEMERLSLAKDVDNYKDTIDRRDEKIKNMRAEIAALEAAASSE
ncbi:MAG: hypothetical protein U9N09_09550, partial [Euryarchaeota archaeon]|nr:hypothetical protein [Euryarchaeota archaeon]